jgi:methenyltetrahydrofolate cyclohydrolase
MSDSIWTDTLEQFRNRIASIEPVPAGVTAAAVSGTLALALLAKVLQVTRNRRDFAGDGDLLGRLLEEARNTFQKLSHLADDDVTVYHEYLDGLRRKHPTDAAIRKTIDVPLNVARTAWFGMSLCEEAAGHVHKVVAPDLGIAAGLLAGVVRSTLVTVNSNIQQLPEDDPYRMETAAEASRLSI